MFSNNFVLAIKVNGKVLREVKDIVYLPFGSEYTILLKNTSSLKAKVKVSVDGQDVTEDVQLIIAPGETTELKRFIRNGNLEAGNAFKFIEKTSQIEEYRGNKAEDGLITVTYEFEKRYPQYDYDTIRYRKSGCWGQSSDNLKLKGLDWDTTQVWCSSDDGVLRSRGLVSNTLGGGTTTSAAYYSSNVASNSSDSFQLSASAEVNDAGITAPGSVVEQKFQLTTSFVTDGVKHSMTLQLKGKAEGGTKVVKQAVVVKKVQRCTMCGTNTKQTAKFCHNCGASVQLV